MKYEIVCTATEWGWRFRVDLYFGRLHYKGQQTYAHHRDAVRAAKATGATVKEIS